MDESLVRFLTVLCWVFIAARIAAGALVRDPVVVLYAMGLATLLAVPVAYYLAYRGGYETLRGDA